jgi:hypothetical protein
VDFDGDVISEVRVDKTAARHQLMKHLELFKEDNEQKPNVKCRRRARGSSSRPPQDAQGVAG